MHFERAKAYFPKQSDELFDREKYDAFIQEFGVNGICPEYLSYFSNSASYISRVFVSKPPIRIRRSEVLSQYEDCLDQCVLNHLFDHMLWCKTNNNKLFLVSMPYSDWDISKAEFHKLQNKFPILNHVDMFLVDNDYKFKKNGSIMLIFMDWRVHRLYYKDILHDGIGGNRIITDNGIKKYDELLYKESEMAIDQWQKDHLCNPKFKPLRGAYINHNPIVLFKVNDPNTIAPFSVQYLGSGKYFKTEEEAIAYMELRILTK